MASSRCLTLIAATDLYHNYRLLGGERLLGSGHECVGPAHALDHAGNKPRVLILDHEVDVVSNIEIKLVAAGDCIRKPQTANRARLQPKLEGAAALKDYSDGSRRQRANAGRRIEQELFAHR